MKILLKELINPNTAILNDTQKAVLLITHISQSGQMAFDNTASSDNLLTARDILVKLGALTMGDNVVALTSRGQSMLNYHNLVDDMGELTEDGQKILDNSEEVGTAFNLQNVQESFKFLSTINCQKSSLTFSE